MLASLVQIFGEDEAFRFMKALNANVNQYARSGIGPMVAANKIAGVRAAVAENEWSARDGVEHVDVNLLTLGELVIGESLAKSIVDAYLSAKVQGGRHERRREQIRELESEPLAVHAERNLLKGRTK